MEQNPFTKRDHRHSERPLVIALTGGIASGKTEVSRRFERLGVPVIDTDIIARQLVEPGQPLLQEIRQKFGEGFIDEEGRLKRRALRQLIFADAEKRKMLEAILHPEVMAKAFCAITSAHAPYCILVIPLLAETGRTEGIDRVLLVDSTESAQVARLMGRDGLDESAANSALAAQSSRCTRLALADDVIQNDDDLHRLDAQIAALHRKYLQLSEVRETQFPSES
jgi:dephospho-CoA kinase